MATAHARHILVTNHLFARRSNQQPTTSATTSRIERQLQETVLEKDLRWLPGVHFLHDQICQLVARRAGKRQACCTPGQENSLEVDTHRHLDLNSQFP